ncbi:MAG: hypothetical protein ACOY0S_00065 [Patescibacteria group bacterium]
MSKIFYDHLIVFEEVIAELDRHPLNPQERQELIALIDETMHHHILDLILSHLPREHHETFLSRFHQAPHNPKLLVFLREVIAIDIEAAIRARAQEVKKQTLAAIHKSRKK